MWTKTPKPTGNLWKKQSSGGKYIYDDLIIYDDSTVQYDGDVVSGWTKIAKPVGTSWTKILKPV